MPTSKNRGKIYSDENLIQILKDRTKGLYYFAHPYTCVGKDGKYVPEGEEANFRLCSYRAGRLLLKGYNIYAPICHTHPIHRATPKFLATHEHELWYQLDMDFIARTDFTGIILAPDWELSVGCIMEKEWFMKHNKPVLLYSHITKEEPL